MHGETVKKINVVCGLFKDAASTTEVVYCWSVGTAMEHDMNVWIWSE